MVRKLITAALTVCLSIGILVCSSCKKKETGTICSSIEVQIKNETSRPVIYIQVNAGKVHALSSSETLIVDVSELGYAEISANLVNEEFGWIDKEISSENCDPISCSWKDSDFGIKPE